MERSGAVVRLSTRVGVGDFIVFTCCFKQDFESFLRSIRREVLLSKVYVLASFNLLFQVLLHLERCVSACQVERCPARTSVKKTTESSWKLS